MRRAAAAERRYPGPLDEEKEKRNKVAGTVPCSYYRVCNRTVEIFFLAELNTCTLNTIELSQIQLQVISAAASPRRIFANFL